MVFVGELVEGLRNRAEHAAAACRVKEILAKVERNAVNHDQANLRVQLQERAQVVDRRDCLGLVVHTEDLNALEKAVPRHALRGGELTYYGILGLVLRRLAPCELVQVTRELGGHFRYTLYHKTTFCVDVDSLAAQPVEDFGDLNVQG